MLLTGGRQEEGEEEGEEEEGFIAATSMSRLVCSGLLTLRILQETKTGHSTGTTCTLDSMQ